MIAEQHELHNHFGEIVGWRKKVFIVREEYSLASSCSWVQKINNCQSLWFSFLGCASLLPPSSAVSDICFLFSFSLSNVFSLTWSLSWSLYFSWCLFCSIFGPNSDYLCIHFLEASPSLFWLTFAHLGSACLHSDLHCLSTPFGYHCLTQTKVKV